VCVYIYESVFVCIYIYIYISVCVFVFLYKLFDFLSVF
jgi:hypothetical protein